MDAGHSSSDKMTSYACTAEKLSVPEIQAMVASTNGFFARDYNLELGWNNVSYLFICFRVVPF